MNRFLALACSLLLTLSMTAETYTNDKKLNESLEKHLTIVNVNEQLHKYDYNTLMHYNRINPIVRNSKMLNAYNNGVNNTPASALYNYNQIVMKNVLDKKYNTKTTNASQADINNIVETTNNDCDNLVHDNNNAVENIVENVDNSKKTHVEHKDTTVTVSTNTTIHTTNTPSMPETTPPDVENNDDKNQEIKEPAITKPVTKPSNVTTATEPYVTEPTVTEPTVTEPAKKPTECIEHSFVLNETTTNETYQFFKSVTKTYICSVCGSSYSETANESMNISDSQLAGYAMEIISYVNSERTSRGLPELWTNGDFNSWAKVRANEQIVRFGHIRPNGASYAYASGNYFTIGENVASGHSSAYGFFKGFMNSAQHRGLMLMEDVVGIAVAISVSEDGTPYCAMHLIAEY